MGESTLAFIPSIGFARVPEIRYTVYVILKRMVSKVPGTGNNPQHTTSRVSPVTIASYMGSFVSGPVSGFLLLREKHPRDSCLRRISSKHRGEGKVSLDLLHHDPEHCTVGTLDISKIFLGSSG